MIGCINTGVLYDDAGSLGIERVLFKQSSRFNLGVIRDIERFIRDNNIDIINFHGANPNYMHRHLKGMLSIPAVTTVHSDYRYDFSNNRIKYLLFTPVNSLCLREFHNFICVSKRILLTLEKRRFRGRKYVVGNGIDTEAKVIKGRDEIRRELGIPSDAFVYTMVARLHPVKNHLSAVAAFKRLQGIRKNARLLLVGGGDFEDRIRSLVNKLSLEPYVYFTGHKQNPIDYVNAGDINILTSFNETFPIVILEGALVGKSAICSDVGDVRDIIDDNTGFLVDPNSPQDIYEKMEQAYSKRSLLDDMGSRLNRSVIDNYTIEKFCLRYYDAYLKILGDNNG